MHRRSHKVTLQRPTLGGTDTAPLPEVPAEIAQVQSHSAPAEPSKFSKPDSLLDVPEATRLLGVSRSSLFELLRTGQLPAVKLGRRTLVRTSDLRRFVANLAAAQYRQPYTAPKPKRGRPHA
ncbi:MAG: helix-turn-helix domain-containing protein [Roseomonas sp.]|nr:helix-turn-helix domain-containing protein [Roseomonas sp.]